MTNDQATFDPRVRSTSPAYRRIPTRIVIVLGIALLAVILLALLLPARSTNLYAVTLNGRIGYINNSGKMIVQPQFANAGRFEEGLAPVFLNNLWGYIDTKGRVVITPQFEVADPFYDGRALVGIGGKFGYID